MAFRSCKKKRKLLFLKAKNKTTIEKEVDLNDRNKSFTSATRVGNLVELTAVGTWSVES